MRPIFDPRLLARFDVGLLLATLAIIGIGSLTVYSATFDPVAGGSGFALRQIGFATIGLLAALGMTAFDYRKLERWAPLIYGLSVALLAAVLLVGQVGGGSRRWIGAGPIRLQPSETVKLALVVLLARYYHHRERPAGLRLRDLGWPLLWTAVPAALILVQPDLGTAGVLCLVAVSVTCMAGLSRGTLGIIGVGVAALVPIAPILFGQLKTYQQKRILTFLDPESDPLGAGYHVIQSKIAIGSGGFLGKGFLSGTQSRLDFLPEQHTDFVFSVLSEEWGFVGAAVVVGLYLALILRGLVVVHRAKERFGTLLAFGVLANIFWQATINLGMITGLFPVVGITLPFVSYGGSSLVTLMLGVGLILNVNMRRLSRERLPRL